MFCIPWCSIKELSKADRDARHSLVFLKAQSAEEARIQDFKRNEEFKIFRRNNCTEPCILEWSGFTRRPQNMETINKLWTRENIIRNCWPRELWYHPHYFQVFQKPIGFHAFSTLILHYLIHLNSSARYITGVWCNEQRFLWNLIGPTR